MNQWHEKPELTELTDDCKLLIWDSATQSTRHTTLETIKEFLNVPLAIPTNITSLATVTASSFYSSGFLPQAAVDGNLATDWASLGQTNPWIQLNFNTPKTVSKVRLADRPTPNEAVNGGTLTFSDGSSVTVSGVPDNGTFLVVDFASRNITWIRFQVVGGRGPNVGLSEFEVWGY